MHPNQADFCMCKGLANYIAKVGGYTYRYYVLSVLNEPIRFVMAQHSREMRYGVNKYSGEGEVRWHRSGL